MIENLSLLADGNSSAARRLRVKLQPRDKKGRWVPTGAALIADISGIGSVKGKAIGGTAEKKGIKNKIRMLVGKGYEKQGIPENTVLEVDPKNGELETGISLSRDYLESKGIDPDLKHTLPEDVADQPENLADMNPQKADALDIELADGGLTKEEDSEFRAERDSEPLAKLPPALAEQAVEGQDVKDIVDGEPSEVSQGAKDVKDMSLDELEQEMGNAIDINAPGSLERLNEVYEEFYARGGNITSPSAADSAVDSALAEAFYNGDVPDVDQLVDKAKAPTPKSSPVAVSDLKPGDVVKVKGSEYPVTSTKQRNSGGWDVFVDDNGRTANLASLKDSNGNSLFPSGIPGSATLEKTGTATLSKPDAADVTPDVTPDSAPSTPTKKKVAPPKPKPTKKTKASTVKKPPVIPQGRKDDGADIAPNMTPLGEMQAVKIDNLIDPSTGKPLRDQSGKTIEDPNAIYNALLEQNPQAKIDKSGHIVLERQDFTDNDGRVWKYEVAVAKTHGNKYIERYKFTDDKGETKTFYHYDYKDSFAAIYGDKNGVYVFRDQLLGRAIPGKYPPTRNTLNYFGDNKTVNDRIRFFRGMTKEGYEPTPDDLATKSSFKLLTPEEVVVKFLQGRAEKYNKSGQAKGTVLQNFVGSVWEAIEADDLPTFEARVQQLLGRLPDDESSRELLMKVLRDGIKEKFNGTPYGRKLSPLANNLEKKILTEGLDIKDLERRPFSAKDGKTIVQRGDKVRYWNNVGEWSIGEVVAQLPPRKASGGKNTYDDVVAVRFGDGSIHLLRSNRMDVLGEDLDFDLNLHDKDSDSTDFKPNLKGQELRDARGYGFDFGEEERRDSDNSDAEPDDVVNTADTDAAAPYLGEQGVGADESDVTDTEDAAAPEGNILDFEAGDVWPDENGDRMGTFVEAQKVSDPDTGTEAWAVIWLDDDGDEQLEIIPLDSSRVPK